MFQRITVYSFICLTLTMLFLGILFVRVRPSDLKACAHIRLKDTIASSQGLLAATQQERKNVKKDIYFAQEDNSRLHYRIYSQTSLLTMQPKGQTKKIELNEKLEKIKCWMQDKLYYSTPGEGPMQHIRFLEAEEGLYCYTSQQFLAQSVALSLFRLPDHDLPKELKSTPFLKGIAQDVSFAVSGKTPNFKAQYFKAELNHTIVENNR